MASPLSPNGEAVAPPASSSVPPSTKSSPSSSLSPSPHPCHFRSENPHSCDEIYSTPSSSAISGKQRPSTSSTTSLPLFQQPLSIYKVTASSVSLPDDLHNLAANMENPHPLRDDKGGFFYPDTYEMSQNDGLEYEHRLYRANSIFSRMPVLSFDIEKRGGEIHPGPLPEATSYVWSKVRFIVLSAYRKLFSLIFLGNLAGLLYIALSFNNGKRISNLSTAVATNLLVAVLIRQDFIVNALFSIFALTPHWVPLKVRRVFAKIYEYGGIHTGAAISATMWYIFLTEEITRTYIKAYRNGVQLKNMYPVLAFTWVPLILLIMIVILAMPGLRRRFHDHFEASHRFGGWMGIAAIWIQSIVFADATRGAKSLGLVLAQSPSFWFLLTITACIILPWLRLRKVVVRPQRLSDHATRLWFDTVKVGWCQGFAVSDSPLFEWHTFASLPAADYSSCSLLVSNAGDWTKKQINQGPHKLWVRGFPRTGVLRIAPIFRSVIMVATGSGIGPQLSFLLGCPDSVKCRLLWSARNPQKTYGEEIMALVNQVDPEAVIIDTQKTGRPDLAQIIYELYVKLEAEAVFIISNRKITRSTVYTLESRGIPAYGPVFDS
ncbi:hypothetical protein Dda_1986 [Drechslerella dactyloides]|uniref:Non-ribosomal peptide synthetase n=1 Tax=Drechslerella dactyloides TaxID=74499 RepID=A0AAD6NNI3_DREDA|nr:hypothetical protein Dda_1986 [Drechslerella dactyloides]